MDGLALVRIATNGVMGLYLIMMLHKKCQIIFEGNHVSTQKTSSNVIDSIDLYVIDNE